MSDIEQQKTNDPVNHPNHYVSLGAHCLQCCKPIEYIDIVRRFNFNLGNAIKYIWRSNFKENTMQDLQKAIWYLQDEIMRISRG